MALPDDGFVVAAAAIVSVAVSAGSDAADDAAADAVAAVVADAAAPDAVVPGLKSSSNQTVLASSC